jgi:hypothetical protein
MTMKPNTNGETEGERHEVMEDPREGQKGAASSQFGGFRKNGKESPQSSTMGRPSRRGRRPTQNPSGPARKNPKEVTVPQSVLERTADQITESAHQASRATCAVADAIEDGVGVVRRAAKQGGDAAEEFLNDTTKRLQRNPALTVAATFAVGLTAGAVIGWMMRRR